MGISENQSILGVGVDHRAVEFLSVFGDRPILLPSQCAAFEPAVDWISDDVRICGGACRLSSVLEILPRTRYQRVGVLGACRDVAGELDVCVLSGPHVGGSRRSAV